MSETEKITKKYLDSRYGKSQFPILFLSANCRKVYYANLAAEMSFGKLAKEGVLADSFCDGWKDTLKSALKQDGIAFIPLKDTSFFTHAKLIPIKRSGKTHCYEIHMVSSDTAKSMDHDIPAALIALDIAFKDVYDAIREAKDEYQSSEIINELNVIEHNTDMMFNFKSDTVEFLWSNLLTSRNDRRTFTLQALIMAAAKIAYPIDITPDNSLAAKFLRINGNFDLYRIMIEEVLVTLAAMTPDTSAISIAVDRVNDRAELKFLKRGMKHRIGAIGTDPETVKRTPMLNFMQNVIGSMDVEITFSRTNDAITATVSLPIAKQELTQEEEKVKKKA